MKMVILVFIFILSILSNPLYSAHLKGEIVKFSKTKQKAIINFSVAPGMENVKKILARGPNKKLCKLTPIKFIQTKVLVSLMDCPFRQSLRSGQMIVAILNAPIMEGPMEDDPEEEESPEKKKEKKQGNVDRSIKDLMYMPLAKTVFWWPGYKLFTKERTITTTSGDEITTNNTSSLENTLGFAYSDNLTLKVKIPYNLSDSQKSNDSLVTDKTRGGLSDPVFGVLYRYMDQQIKGFNLDLLLDYTFAMGDSEGYGETAGNGSNGKSIIDLGLRLGKKYGKYALEGKIQMIMAGQGESIDPDDKTAITTEDAYSDIKLLVSGQYHYSPTFLLNGSLGYESNGAITQTFSTDSSISNLIERGSSTLLGLGGSYIFHP